MRYFILAAVCAALLVPSSADSKRSPRPPHDAMWECIHSKEASWSDDGSPYWGGLQMGWWFMSTYASRLLRVRGTANRWSANTQKWVAEKAWRREGYSMRWLRGQWPNTSWGCV